MLTETLSITVLVLTAVACGIPVRGFLIGAVAAMAGAAISHPFDLIKVRLQVQDTRKSRLGVPGMVKAVLSEGGPPAFFRGVSAALMRQFFYSGTRFAAYEPLKAVLPTVGAAALAGVAGATVGAPCEVALVRLQAGTASGGVLGALAQIARTDGMAALYGGFTPMCVRAIVVTVGQLTSYDVLKDILGAYVPDGPALHLSASIVAGFIAAAVSNPVDVIKTRMQASKKGEYKSTAQCVMQTVKQEGVLGLVTKGLLPTCVRMVPYVAIMLFSNETLKRWF